MNSTSHKDAEKAEGGFFDRRFQPASKRGLRYRMYRLLFHCCCKMQLHLYIMVRFR